MRFNKRGDGGQNKERGSLKIPKLINASHPHPVYSVPKSNIPHGHIHITQRSQYIIASMEVIYVSSSEGEVEEDIIIIAPSMVITVAATPTPKVII